MAVQPTFPIDQVGILIKRIYGAAIDEISLTGDETLFRWVHPTLPPPTLEQLEAEWVLLQAERAVEAEADQERQRDMSELKGAKVTAALAQIVQEREQIAAGKTALAAASSLAQVRPIIEGMLTILDRMEVRQERIIKALWRVADKE